jgi:hypothetical protein
MADPYDWLEVTLDANSRHGLAEAIEHSAKPANEEELPRLLRMLRSSRDELLLDKQQAEIVLAALNVDKRMSALRARLEAFLGMPLSR